MDLQEATRKYDWISSEFGVSVFKLLYYNITYGSYETLELFSATLKNLFL